jgi:hypothetical protein
MAIPQPGQQQGMGGMNMGTPPWLQSILQNIQAGGNGRPNVPQMPMGGMGMGGQMGVPFWMQMLGNRMGGQMPSMMGVPQPQPLAASASQPFKLNAPVAPLPPPPPPPVPTGQLNPNQQSVFNLLMQQGVPQSAALANANAADNFSTFAGR